MLRKRIIFTLLYADGYFWLSRNFRLQKVGDIHWLENNYKFSKISTFIDELVVLNVSRQDKSIDDFAAVISRLVNNVFIPVAAGGGIKSLEDAKVLFLSGADKLVINTILTDDISVVKEIISTYGSQSVVASVDYTKQDGMPVVLKVNGTVRISMSLNDYLGYLERLDVGEIYLNSIDKDGTGFGLDVEILKDEGIKVNKPIILAGGAGNEIHLELVLLKTEYSAVATANLFNFIGNGLPIARKYLEENNLNISPWYKLNTQKTFGS